MGLAYEEWLNSERGRRLLFRSTAARLSEEKATAVVLSVPPSTPGRQALLWRMDVYLSYPYEGASEFGICYRPMFLNASGEFRKCRYR